MSPPAFDPGPTKTLRSEGRLPSTCFFAARFRFGSSRSALLVADQSASHGGRCTALTEAAEPSPSRFLPPPDTFACDISEETILNATKALVSTGLRDLGYNYGALLAISPHPLRASTSGLTDALCPCSSKSSSTTAGRPLSARRMAAPRPTLSASRAVSSRSSTRSMPSA